MFSTFPRQPPGISAPLPRLITGETVSGIKDIVLQSAGMPRTPSSNYRGELGDRRADDARDSSPAARVLLVNARQTDINGTSRHAEDFLSRDGNST